MEEESPTIVVTKGAGSHREEQDCKFAWMERHGESGERGREKRAYIQGDEREWVIRARMVN